jgi:RNA polymerase sigma factor (sigma-70 family)
VAYRMLGSASDAEDAVQEAWLRVSRAGTDGVHNLGGWLTTVVARVCLDALRSRRSRPEDPLEHAAELGSRDEVADPEHEAVLADALGPALLVVLDTLAPAERLAFVLHDLFAVPFEDIAPIVGRTPTAARQLASRARRRVQGARIPEAAANRQRQVVDAFLAASRGGDFDALLALLDPNVVLRADPAAVVTGARPRVDGAAEVAATFSGRAQAARPALVDGAPGAVWMQGGQARIAFSFAVVAGKVVAIELVAEPARLASVELTPR